MITQFVSKHYKKENAPRDVFFKKLEMCETLFPFFLGCLFLGLFLRGLFFLLRHIRSWKEVIKDFIVHLLR